MNRMGLKTVKNSIKCLSQCLYFDIPFWRILLLCNLNRTFNFLIGPFDWYKSLIKTEIILLFFLWSTATAFMQYAFNYDCFRIFPISDRLFLLTWVRDGIPFHFLLNDFLCICAIPCYLVSVVIDITRSTSH